MAKITGIGGVFFKSRNDRAVLAAWYQKYLGIPLESWGGAVLKWPDDTGEDRGSPYGMSQKRKASGSAPVTPLL